MFKMYVPVEERRPDSTPAGVYELAPAGELYTTVKGTADGV